MPVILKKQTSKIIKALNKNKITPENISPSERTELLKTINKKPVYASLLAGAVSLFSNIILFFVITFLFSDKGADTVFLIIPFLAVSLYESIDTFSYDYEICTEECKTLALGKLDDEMIHNENHFGVSIITFFVIHIILPFLGFASTLISIRLFQMKTGGTHFVFLLPLLVVQILFMLIFSFRYKENSIDEILSVTSK